MPLGVPDGRLILHLCLMMKELDWLKNTIWKNIKGKPGLMPAMAFPTGGARKLPRLPNENTNPITVPA